LDAAGRSSSARASRPKRGAAAATSSRQRSARCASSSSRTEIAFAGHVPVERRRLNIELRDEVRFSFDGIGFAVNGAAVGVGATMTLPMDVRIASEDARFGFVFARRGIVPEAASSWFLPRVVGISQAMEWVATGRVFGAAEALAGRLVSRVVPAAELLPAAHALAREIADNTSAISVALARQMLWKMLGADHPMEAHKVDSQAIFSMGRSADAYEGVQSFLEKRPPRFTMKPSSEMPAFFPWWKERKFSE
jgi:1,4-dihydroxy-2-naphthoyl-CoA synthase